MPRIVRLVSGRQLVTEAARRLTAVLVADVQGYTRLMEVDEEGTRRLLNLHRERFADLSANYGGRVIDTSGDSVLAEFDSVQHAVECAVEFQLSVAVHNADSPYTEYMEYRIGVNVGDVLDDGVSIYGDAVNTAARIQSLAPPGGVCVSSAVREIVEGRVRFGFQFLREQRVKNRSRSVRVFRVMTEPRTDLRRFPGSIPIKLTLGDEPGIAVLPFSNLGPDRDKQYLGDGIAEDIITELSRFRSIHVMARTTSFSYRDEEDRFSKLRDELNVQYALEGSIRSVGRKIRITAQLVECETGKHIWGDRYTHDADAIFDVQDEVVSLIVSMLENRLLKDRMRASARSGGQTRRAYDLWLRGNQLLERLSIEAADQAEQHFAEAVETDPQFSRGYSGLASVLYLRASLSPGKKRWYTEVQRALEYSRTAARLDPADGRAQVLLGWGCMLTRDFDEGPRHFEVAGDLNPNDADILIARARAGGLLGQAKDALDLATRAMRLNPVHPRHYLEWMGEIKFFAGRFEDCVDTFTTNPPATPEHAAFLAAALGQLGARSSAREAGARFVELVNSAWKGPVSADVSKCLSWLGRVVPIKNVEDRQSLLDGLAVAGLEGQLADDSAGGAKSS